MIVRTLGGLTLEGASFHRPKPLLLLAYLSIEGPAERRYLSELFWMRAANARRSLTMALSQLRAGAPESVGTDDVRVWSVLECDAALLLRAVEQKDWLGAWDLYRGPFLEGFEPRNGPVELEEWIYGTREALAQAVRGALLSLGESAAGEGRFGEGGAWAERAHAVGETAPPEPGDLARLYVLLLASESSKSRTVREEGQGFGLDLPSTVEAARRSLRAPARASSDTSRVQGLPLRTTSFIGRQQELAELRHQLNEPGGHLLSLVGAGGTGKTRLGLHLATTQAGSGAWDGVHFVALETLRDVGEVAPALADALGLRLRSQPDAVTQLRQAIGSSAHLMILDNFEHLLAAAPLLSELVRACPHLHLVVTSRERLNLDDERPLLLEGLAVPREGTRSAEEALQYAAVSLFVQRARRARSDFTLADAPLAAVLRICHLVGGMPLALEMAAAWVRAMSCSEIADEIEKGLDLLESPTRDRPERHRSMRVALEHSWQLLSPTEQAVTQDMSLFRGGFGREAAARVAGASLARLASLTDRSLLAWNGVDRYHLHPLWQQFLAEKTRLQPKASSKARNRHAEYFLTRVAARREAFPRGNAAAAAAEIEADLANVLAAWEWAAKNGRNDLLVDAVQPMGWFFLIRGRPRQGHAWSEIPVNAEGASLIALRRLHFQAAFLKELGREPEATERIEGAVRLAELLDARPELAHALRLAGIIYSRLDPPDWVNAEAAYHRSLAQYRDLEDMEGAAMMLTLLSHWAAGPRQALETLHEALELARNAGETHAIALNLGFHAELLMHCAGDYENARSAAEESVACHEATGFDFHHARTLLILGEVLLALGDDPGAEKLAERARELSDAFQASAQATIRGGSFALLGHVMRARGALDSAVAAYRESFGLLREPGRNETSVWWSATSLNGLARLALMRGRAREAQAHADEGLALLKRFEMSKSFVLPSARLACLVRLGEALTLEGQYKRAEEHLRGALSLAREWEREPAILETLLAVAELRQQQAMHEEADEIFVSVAAHGASPLELVTRAKSAMQRPSRAR